MTAALVQSSAETQAAMAGRVKVRPLVWESFDAWTYWATSAVGTYRVQERNGVWKATVHRKDNDDLIYEYTTDGLTPNDFEAAQIAAQADYEARILAALQPDTERAKPVADVVRGVWGRCEALEDEAYAKLESDKLTDHEIGFWRGQKLAAKSIRRSTELPQPAPAQQTREITVQEAAEVQEVKELIEAAWCAGRDAAATAAFLARPLSISQLEAIGALMPPEDLRAIAAMQKGG